MSITLTVSYDDANRILEGLGLFAEMVEDSGVEPLIEEDGFDSNEFNRETLEETAILRGKIESAMEI